MSGKREELLSYTGSRLHLIDCSFLARSRYFYFKDFSVQIEGSKVYTGAMYAIFSVLKYIPIEDDIIFTFDFGGNKRKEMYKGYKDGRTSPEQSYYEQMEAMYKILEDIGYIVLGKKGFEADDFIVGATRVYKSQYDHIFVHTADKDLAQVVSDGVHFFSASSKVNNITMDNFEEELKIPYNLLVLYKSMVGDSSDNVSGISRFGPVSFDKFLKKIEGKYDYSMVRKKDMEFQIIDESDLSFKKKQQAFDSLKVIKPILPDTRFFGEVNQNLNFDLLRWTLEKYEFNSLLKYIPEKKSLF